MIRIELFKYLELVLRSALVFFMIILVWSLISVVNANSYRAYDVARIRELKGNADNVMFDQRTIHNYWVGSDELDQEISTSNTD